MSTLSLQRQNRFPFFYTYKQGSIEIKKCLVLHIAGIKGRFRGNDVTRRGVGEQGCLNEQMHLFTTEPEQPAIGGTPPIIFVLLAYCCFRF